MRKYLVICAACCGAMGLTLAHAVEFPGESAPADQLGRRPDVLPTFRVPAAPFSPESPAASGAEQGNPLWATPLEALHATRERPLFSPSRRPAMPVQRPQYVKAAPPPEPDQPALNLLGTIVGGSAGYAVLLNVATHTVIRLRTGEGENGWILRSVAAREAILEKDHRIAVIRLPPATGEQK